MEYGSFKMVVTTGTGVLRIVLFKMGKFSLEVAPLLVFNSFWALKSQYFVQPYHNEILVNEKLVMKHILKSLKNLIDNQMPVMCIFKHNSNT